MFSTLLGGSPGEILTGIAPYTGFHPFDVSHLVQTPAGDYYMLGATATGRFPGMAVDAEGNALVLETVRELGAPIGKSFILRITPIGEVTTVAELSGVAQYGVEGTWLGRDRQGNLFAVGHDYIVGRVKRGYLAVFDAEGNKVEELDDLPWDPEAAAVSPDGSLYIVTGSTLRKFKPLLAEEEARAKIPIGARAIYLSPTEKC